MYYDIIEKMVQYLFIKTKEVFKKFEINNNFVIDFKNNEITFNDNKNFIISSNYKTFIKLQNLIEKNHDCNFIGEFNENGSFEFNCDEDLMKEIMLNKEEFNDDDSEMSVSIAEYKFLTDGFPNTFDDFHGIGPKTIKKLKRKGLNVETPKQLFGLYMYYDVSLFQDELLRNGVSNQISCNIIDCFNTFWDEKIINNTEYNIDDEFLDCQ